MRSTIRAGRATAAAALIALAGPAAASAAITQQVQDDGGTFVPITAGLSISNMAPKVTISAPPEDAAKYYTYAVTGPNGAAVAIDNACLKLQYGAIARTVNFVGDGAYTMTTKLFSDADCTTAAAGGGAGSFTVNAGAAITTPSVPLLTRDPGSFATKTYALPTGVSPNGTQEILYRLEGAFDPVTGISGATADDVAYKVNDLAQVSFRQPGRYTFTTRARAGDPSGYTPWTQPQFVDVKAPFDLSTNGWTDSIGPSYRATFTFREQAVAGKIRMRVRRLPHGVYRTIGRPTARAGVVTKRFTLRRSGRYQMRLEFPGSALVAPGVITIGFRITHHLL